MLSPEPENLRAVLELEMVAKQGMPIVFWVGAGVSRFAGVPTWSELAASMHCVFSKTEVGYDRNGQSSLLRSEQYPAFFSARLARRSAFRGREATSALGSSRGGGRARVVGVELTLGKAVSRSHAGDASGSL